MYLRMKSRRSPGMRSSAIAHSRRPSLITPVRMLSKGTLPTESRGDALKRHLSRGETRQAGAAPHRGDAASRQADRALFCGDPPNGMRVASRLRYSQAGSGEVGAGAPASECATREDLDRVTVIPSGEQPVECRDIAARSRIATREPWDIATALLLAALALLVACTFRQYSISNDEGVQQRYGELIIAYYASGFHDRALFAFDNL